MCEDLYKKTAKYKRNQIQNFLEHLKYESYASSQIN